MSCFVSWRSSLRAMFVTIWMCTHEWSLISRRSTAFTFETCHQPLSCRSALTRSISVRSLRFPRTGTRMRIPSTACAGVNRVSRSASAEAGCSIRSSVSSSSGACASSGMGASLPPAAQSSILRTVMREHPVRLVVTDDLARRRVTVLFRVILAIPHYVWAVVWTIGAFFAAIAAWFLTLVRGRPPDGLYEFLSNYVRYLTQLAAYVLLAASPYPTFTG